MELQNRKPTPKKNFSLDNYKKKVVGEDVPDKPIEWFRGSPAFQKVTGIPGFAKGYVGLSRGFTNTGKSTAVSEGLVSAQKMGVLPIIIDTENNIGRERLANMGFDWKGNFIDIDNEYLLDHFGRAKEKDKREASIEDLADCIHFFLDQQEAGELPFELLFMIDSLGTLDCNATIKAKSNDTTQNNMWNAGAFERAFKSIVNYRIPNSRKQNKLYTNTIIGVQKIWTQGTAPMITVKHKGGEAFAYGARLIFHHGGIVSAGAKAVVATFRGKDVSYGIKANIEAFKNQVDGDGLGGISLQGEIISTPHGFIEATKEAIDEYKSKHIKFFQERLGADATVADIGTKLVDIKSTDTNDPEE
jgi:hypothetical protein